MISRFNTVKYGLLVVLSLVAVTAVGAPWTLVERGGAPIQLQVKAQGDETLVEMIALADFLGIHHQMDIDGEQVFFFPEAPLVVVPYGSFLTIGNKTVHLPMPVEFGDNEVWLTESIALNLIRNHTAGFVDVRELSRTIVYVPSESDLLKIEGRGDSLEIIYRIVATKPLKADVELLDSATVLFQCQGARLIPVKTETTEQDSLPASLQWDLANHGFKITTGFPIGGVRLQGPDRGNVFELHLKPLEDVDSPLAYGEKTVYEELADARKNWEIDVIVIDPGHGGKDPGAIGPNSLFEKDVVLDIGLRLRGLIQQELGIKVVMTRDSDVFIPLNERTSIANTNGGKLFVSLHCNAARSRSANGSETYFLAPARTERAMAVALKENSVIKYEESQEGYVDLTEENYILLAMAQAQFVKESEVFAATIQEKLVERSGLKDRGVDQAGFYVLIGASMPAVLVETAFISNHSEEKLLNKAEFRQLVAEQIFAAINEFVEQVKE